MRHVIACAHLHTCLKLPRLTIQHTSHIRFLLDIRHIECLNSLSFLILILQKSQGKKMLSSTSLCVSPYRKCKLRMLENSIEITQHFTFFFDVTFFCFNWWTLPRKQNVFSGNNWHSFKKHNINGTERNNCKIIQYPQAQNLANTHY